MKNINKMSLTEIRAELNFLKGYLAYLKYENPLYKEYQNKFDMLENEGKRRNIEEYRTLKNQFRGF